MRSVDSKGMVLEHIVASQNELEREKEETRRVSLQILTTHWHGRTWRTLISDHVQIEVVAMLTNPLLFFQFQVLSDFFSFLFVSLVPVKWGENLVEYQNLLWRNP